MSKPKPKSVDECWMVEAMAPFNDHFEPCEVFYSKMGARQDVKMRKLNSHKTYRIRKWRAETMCEWREDCDREYWYFTKCKRYRRMQDDKYCGCGGKIKVRK